MLQSLKGSYCLKACVSKRKATAVSDDHLAGPFSKLIPCIPGRIDVHVDTHNPIGTRLDNRQSKAIAACNIQGVTVRNMRKREQVTRDMFSPVRRSLALGVG